MTVYDPVLKEHPGFLLCLIETMMCGDFTKEWERLDKTRKDKRPKEERFFIDVFNIVWLRMAQDGRDAFNQRATAMGL